jgi:hypothetical protein
LETGAATVKKGFRETGREEDVLKETGKYESKNGCMVFLS